MKIKENLLPLFIGFVLGIVFIIGFFMACGYALYHFSVKPKIENHYKDIPAPEIFVQQPADYSLKFQDLEGNAHSLGEYRGKVILLNIWATWCPPCVAELPSIGKLEESMKGNPNVVILCVSKESLEIVAEKQKKDSVSAPIYVTDKKSFPEVYMTDSIPATFIISPAGMIVQKHTGMARWDDKSVIDYLISLSKEIPRKAD